MRLCWANPADPVACKFHWKMMHKPAISAHAQPNYCDNHLKLCQTAKIPIRHRNMTLLTTTATADVRMKVEITPFLCMCKEKMPEIAQVAPKIANTEQIRNFCCNNTANYKRIICSLNKCYWQHAAGNISITAKKAKQILFTKMSAVDPEGPWSHGHQKPNEWLYGIEGQKHCKLWPSFQHLRL